MNEKRLRVFAEWLKGVDIYVDPYYDGQLERAIKHSQEETMQKIGDYLEEILDFDEDQLDNELKPKKKDERDLPF